MKLKMSTEVLKEMVSRAVKGVGNVVSRPITAYMGITCQNNILTLTTCDEVNYLYIKSDKVEAEDFYVTIEAEKFAKLVSKLTCETVEMEVTGNAFVIKGNGTYQLDLQLEEGELIKYPDPVSDLKLKEKERKEVASSVIRNIIDTCKSSLATTLEVPCYTGYYAGECVAATNDYVMTCLDVNLFEQDVLISPDLVDLLNLMTVEKFSVYIQNDTLVATSPDCVVYGKLMEGIEEFPFEAVKNYVSQELPNSCKISKTKLLSVLDRILLFVNPYDDDAIRITFTKDGLNIESKQNTGIETIPYLESKKFNAFTGLMDIKEFVATLKSYPEEEIKMQYGSDKCLKLTSGDLSVAVAWLIEDTVSEEE